MYADKSFECSIEQATAKFYRFFNCLLNRSKHALSEPVNVNLMKAYSIPLFVYGTDVLILSKSDLSNLDNCIKVAVMNFFLIQDTNYVACVRHICDLPKLSKVIRTRKCNFLSRLWSTGQI